MSGYGSRNGYSPYFPRGWNELAKCGSRSTNDYDVSVILGAAARQPTPKDLVALSIRAKELCTGCPVKPECAQLALDTDADGMVYAGIPIPNRNNNPNTVARIHAARFELQRIAAPLKRRNK